ncbi:hypothetical protein JHK84_047860 [Glycine max]|nr:hypothetical protein JHK86_047837 [Glycine max]KAG5102891.1 hypothetical protein JHK84_047860 [Glycine max]
MPPHRHVLLSQERYHIIPLVPCLHIYLFPIETPHHRQHTLLLHTQSLFLAFIHIIVSQKLILTVAFRFEMGILFGNGNIFWWVGSFSIEEEAGDRWRRFGDLDFGKGEKGGSGIVVLELGYSNVKKQFSSSDNTPKLSFQHTTETKSPREDHYELAI